MNQISSHVPYLGPLLAYWYKHYVPLKPQVPSSQDNRWAQMLHQAKRNHRFPQKAQDPLTHQVVKYLRQNFQNWSSGTLTSRSRTEKAPSNISFCLFGNPLRKRMPCYFIALLVGIRVIYCISVVQKALETRVWHKLWISSNNCGVWESIQIFVDANETVFTDIMQLTLITDAKAKWKTLIFAFD